MTLMSLQGTNLQETLGTRGVFVEGKGGEVFARKRIFYKNVY